MQKKSALRMNLGDLEDMIIGADAACGLRRLLQDIWQ
jgi:hypothetical protein